MQDYITNFIIFCTFAFRLTKCYNKTGMLVNKLYSYVVLLYFISS